jgi:hypothetical protein
MKLRIDNRELVEEFFQDSRMIGIVAPLKAYHFCWLLNNELRIDFRTSGDLEIQLEKKNRKYFFSIYCFKDLVSSREHFLYENQFDGEYLLPEYKHLDFIWIFKEEEPDEDYFHALQSHIKNIENVQLVMEIREASVKNKSNLII